MGQIHEPGTSACIPSNHPLPRLSAIDLFAGAGGLSFGFHLAGFEVVAAVEFDQQACKSYKTSFVEAHSPRTKALHQDVTDPSTLSELKDALAERRLDVLIGGPPCQDFSPARLKHKRVTKRASLVLRYIELLKALRPRAFLFENVPGLVTADGGTHWRRLERRLRDIGYSVQAEQLDAQAFLVPQRRRRLFVVGVEESEPASFDFPTPSEARITVKQAFEAHAKYLPSVRLGEHPQNDPNHRARRHRPATVEMIASIKQGESWRHARDRGGRVLDCHQDHKGHYDVYGRIDDSKVAPTMTGGCTNPSKGRFIHPTADRGLTVREAALLQTFPPDWQFFGGVERESQQVGNAVPVRLGQALATAMRQALLP